MRAKGMETWRRIKFMNEGSVDELCNRLSVEDMTC